MKKRTYKCYPVSPLNWCGVYFLLGHTQLTGIFDLAILTRLIANR